MHTTAAAAASPTAVASPPAIEIHRLTKTFRKTTAVADISLTVPRGSVVGFLGPNGAGKTSTIKMLMGLLAPTSGGVRVLGLDPRRDALELRNRVGYVPDNHHIYQWMTVPQVFRFAAAAFRDWDRRECDRLVEFLRLPTARRVKDLSRGETTKLALVVALAHRPGLLILDEPTTGLDPLVRQEFLDAAAAVIRDSGRTVFFSTHILSDVDRIADRLVVMDAGRIIADDTLDSLRSRYTKASFVFPRPPAPDLVIPGALRVYKGLREWVATFRATDDATLRATASAVGASDCMAQPMTVEDVFLELFNHHPRPDAPAPHRTVTPIP
jgi:ABC-2 type transport system ATP-binding protein